MSVQHWHEILIPHLPSWGELGCFGAPGLTFTPAWGRHGKGQDHPGSILGAGAWLRMFGSAGNSRGDCTQHQGQSPPGAH